MISGEMTGEINADAGMRPDESKPLALPTVGQRGWAESSDFTFGTHPGFAHGDKIEVSGAHSPVKPGVYHVVGIDHGFNTVTPPIAVVMNSKHTVEQAHQGLVDAINASIEPEKSPFMIARFASPMMLPRKQIIMTSVYPGDAWPQAKLDSWLAKSEGDRMAAFFARSEHEGHPAVGRRPKTLESMRTFDWWTTPGGKNVSVSIRAEGASKHYFFAHRRSGAVELRIGGVFEIETDRDTWHGNTIAEVTQKMRTETCGEALRVAEAHDLADLIMSKAVMFEDDMATSRHLSFKELDTKIKDCWRNSYMDDFDLLEDA